MEQQVKEKLQNEQSGALNDARQTESMDTQTEPEKKSIWNKFWNPETIPGIILAVILFLVPFLGYELQVSVTTEEANAYFMGSSYTNEFEQLIRQNVLFATAICFTIWGLSEKFFTKNPMLKLEGIKERILCCLMLVYMLMTVLSLLFCDHKLNAWRGGYMQYEGTMAILAYGIIFLCACFFYHKKETIQFLLGASSWFCIALGVLAILEYYYGMPFYNISFIHMLTGMSGYLDATPKEPIQGTFGNADYLSVTAAMLLPIQASMFRWNDEKILRMMRNLLSTIMVAWTLWLTEVAAGIILGFLGLAIVIFVRAFQLLKKNAYRVIACSVLCVVVLGCGVGYISIGYAGDSFGEKIETFANGVEKPDNFQLLIAKLDGRSLLLKNEECSFVIAEDGDDYCYTLDGETITGTEVNHIVTFQEEQLQHIAITIEERKLSIDMGYNTALEIEVVGTGSGNWEALSMGGRELEEIPLVTENERLRSCFTFFNGRVFVWENTWKTLGDNILIGNGMTTSIFNLNQNDLPALLNIFGQYVLYNKPHNWYLQIAQDSGFVALASVLGLIGIVLVRGGKNIFRRGKKCNAVMLGVFLGLTIYCIEGIFNDSLVFHAPTFWLFLGAYWCMCKNYEAEEKREEIINA